MAVRGKSILDTERVSMTDKGFGILCAGSDDNENGMVSRIVGTLISSGCLEQNIKIRKVPSAEEIPLGVLFFAEYTDVDAVIVLTFDYNIKDYIRSSVADLQIQWNMPTVIGVAPETLAQRAMDMVSLQEQMETESDSTANPDRSSIN